MFGRKLESGRKVRCLFLGGFLEEKFKFYKKETKIKRIPIQNQGVPEFNRFSIQQKKERGKKMMVFCMEEAEITFRLK